MLSLSDLALQEKDYQWLLQLKAIDESTEIEYTYNNSGYGWQEIRLCDKYIGLINENSKKIIIDKGTQLDKKLQSYVNAGFNVKYNERSE